MMDSNLVTAKVKGRTFRKQRHEIHICNVIVRLHHHGAGI